MKAKTLSLSILLILILFSLSLPACGDADDTSDGDTTDGDTEDGDTEDGDTTDGDATDGDTTDGDVADGDTTDGDTTDGDVEAIQALVDSVDQDIYTSELTFVADVRTPGNEHWQAVQDRCVQRFEENGFDVELQDYGSGINVIGVKPGTKADAPHVIVCAHYDHIRDCPGADDNASGIAGVFEAARILGSQTFENTLVLACWDEEELGLIGAANYAERANDRGDEILAVFNFETMAYTEAEPGSQVLPAGFELLFTEASDWLVEHEYKGDFIALIADDLAAPATTSLLGWAERIALPAVLIELTESQKNSNIFADMRRSDHAAFWLYDYPAMMLTDTANFRNPYYHCKEGPDTVDTLDIPFAVKVTRATLGAAVEMLKLQ